MIQPPHGDARPATRPRVWLTWVLLWAIVLVYVISCLLSGSLFQPAFPVLIVLGAKENSLVAAGEYWRLLSATFLHANLVHIFFNSYALFALGPESERIYGTARFAAVYFIAGLGGSVASYLFSPAPAVGASGAIFGLIGALGIFYYLSRQALGAFGRMQVQSIASIAAINLVIGFASAGTIDNWGHMGGLVSGLLAGLALAPRLSVDTGFFPPVLVRWQLPWGWAAAAALALALGALAVLLPGAGV
ncbi:MAG: rhomboid family intramembrane serine protease [Chloroflexi bacterium OHK40]